MEVDELQKGNMKPKVKLHVIYVLLIIAFVVLAILSLPLVPETRITVVTYLDTITNVSVDTPRIPIIVGLFPLSSVGTGAYTINVNASLFGMLVFNATLQNVPSGQYTFVWVYNGQPKTGTYHLVVELVRLNVPVNSYALDVTYG